MNPPASAHPGPDPDLAKVLWSFADVLREDGVSGLEYVEQLACLILLKLAHEQSQRPLNPVEMTGYDEWAGIRYSAGQEQRERYEQALDRLAYGPGNLGLLFRKVQNRIPDPVKLARLIDLVDSYHWSGDGNSSPGAIFDALLARMTADPKTGAGQFFTPRPLVEAIVQCVQPGIGDTIIDPACGTGGFLTKSFEYLIEHFPPGVSPAERARLSQDAFSGTELVDATARLATINLVLHGLTRADAAPLIDVGDALTRTPTRHATLVLTTPPFGRRSTIAGEAYAHYRPDFWAETANRQLNFLQHVQSLLQLDGRAAVVVPDNVLFEAGAGEHIRRRLLDACDVHTLLRLPPGVFYATGVKTSVLFFDKAAPRADGRPSTQQLWVYDLRTHRPAPTKSTTLTSADYDDFVSAYRPGRPRSERVESPVFRSYSVQDLLARDRTNLDLLAADPPDDPLATAEPEADLHHMAQQIADELHSALEELTALTEALRPYGARGDRPDEGPTT
ncbi:type I restriction-modification system subunit M [Streptomyces sp. NBC_01221]|uniref:class I SAM-dependent DNA methyltransferase n=1 Tax=unclassified Streptomyces TaxID=2593676 RepID=UPI002251AC1B|nr:MULTISPECIES: class I SAM-dependent DNA methyltransferase [unclassified Streptomyces]MCX4735076.1 type I restriction-modification system subunit M [Streptomyces sp. NBC_01363]MCX4789704.1 type I restriction-modification system subunit M [Streptomyces sp. NBC_01221]